MPATIVSKAYLDQLGLTYFAQHYPTNTAIEAIVDGIQAALNEKQNTFKCDTTAGWRQDLSFIPDAGEIIIYTDHGTVDNTSVPGIKIGDGTTYGIDLPFVGDDVAASLLSRLQAHVNDTNIHVTAQEKSNWNQKTNVDVQNEILVFNTN